MIVSRQSFPPFAKQQVRFEQREGRKVYHEITEQKKKHERGRKMQR
jgi:hypothetical protein